MGIIDFFKKTTWRSRVILALWLAYSALIWGAIISTGPKEYLFQRTLLALVVWISGSVFFWLPVIGYQKAIAHQENSTTSTKPWITTLLLSIFLGQFGIHRFYTGRIISGVVFCLTMGGFGIGWIIDVLAIALNMFTDGKGCIISKKNEFQNNSTSDFQTGKMQGFSIHTGNSSSRPVYGDVSTHYDGELVLTNKRLVFLSDQKGFEVPYSAITAATAYRDGLSVQSRSHTYTLLLPKADLALIAFDAVRTGEIPIASSRGDSYNNAFEDSEVDCSELIYVEDELFEDAVDAIIETGQASVSILQRKLKIGYSRAARLIDELEKHGIISSFEGSRPRQILISDSEWEEMRDWITFGEEDYSEVDTEETKQTPNVSEIDGMDGHEFEYFCADLLRKNGFVNVKVTPGSGDQGVDILAEKGGVKYAIQCKNYASPLSNTPVQEVNAGKVFYGCHVGVVMTNSTFTPGANALAQATGVLLWDRAFLQKIMKES